MEFIKYLWTKTKDHGKKFVSKVFNPYTWGKFLKWWAILWAVCLQILIIMWALSGNLWVLVVEGIAIFLWWQYRKFKKEQPSNPNS